MKRLGKWLYAYRMECNLCDKTRFFCSLNGQATRWGWRMTSQGQTLCGSCGRWVRAEMEGEK